MKTVKTIELENSGISIEALQDQAMENIKAFIDVSSNSCRSSSNLSGALWSFLDLNHDNVGEYINILTAGLLAFAKVETTEFKKEIGDWHFKGFITIIERAIYMLDEIKGNEASKAEILYYELDTRPVNSTNEIYARLTLNNWIRKYKALAENTAQLQADWEAYDNQFK